MRALLDTNIIIESEGNVELSDSVQEFFRLSEKHKIERCVHKKSIDDISKDTDLVRKKITLSKLEKYPRLDFDRDPDKDYRRICEATGNIHDLIDDYILFSIVRDAVDYLITEDKGIHSKALKLNVNDRVFTAKEFCDFIKAEYELRFPSSLPTIEKVKLVDLDLSDKIFGSLKEDYEDFEEWFKRKSREGREAWVSFFGRDLSSICIFDPSNAAYKGEMKICTFKIADFVQGIKLGELLLREAIRFACANKKETIYIEVRQDEDKEYLISWLGTFGFQRYGIKPEKDSGGVKELIMFKEVTAVPEKKIGKKDIVEIDLEHFPYFIKPPYVQAFFVPIRPEYAQILFPELELQREIPGLERLAPCGRAIRKAYVCKTPTKEIHKGDLIFFYESERGKSIVASAFVEDVILSKKGEEILKFIGKRSVYSKEQIENEFEDGKSIITAVKFIYCEGFPLEKRVSLEKLKSGKILSGAPQSFYNITKDYDKFEKLYDISPHKA